MKQLKGFMHGINLGGWLSQCSEYTQAHYNSFIKEDDIRNIADWQPVISNISMKYPGDINDYRACAKELGCFGSGLNNTDEMGEKFMDALITEAVDAAARADVPIYCGEYGIIDKADINDTLSWYQDISKVFDKYGIGRAAWTYKAMDFGLMEEHYASRRNEIIKCL